MQCDLGIGYPPKHRPREFLEPDPLSLNRYVVKLDPVEVLDIPARVDNEYGPPRQHAQHQDGMWMTCAQYGLEE
ncbi:hypothetical protein N7527_001649 [Penicillium freii]|nr:hypothetical protein N7527_001649 [Penicillium freii]